MKTMIRLPLFLFGLTLLVMTAMLGFVRQEEPTDIAWIYFSIDNGLYRVRFDGRDERLISNAVAANHVYLNESPDSLWLVMFDPSNEIFYRVNRINGAAEVFKNLPTVHDRRISYTFSDQWLVAEVDSTLYSSRLDDTAFEVMLSNEHYFQFGNWSPDGESLLFYSGRDGFRELYIVQMATEAVTRLSYDEGLDNNNDQFSPDGQWILFTSSQVYVSERLFRIRPDGRDLQEITVDEGTVSIYRPQWLPNGDWIVYRGCVNDCDLYRVRSDGSDLQEILSTEVNELVVAWSEESRWLVASAHTACETELYRVDMDSLQIVRLANHVTLECENAEHFPISPEQQFIVVNAYVPQASGFNLWLVPTDGSPEIQASLPEHNAIFPVWSPDGTWILVQATVKGDMRNRQLFRIELESGEMYQLSHVDGYPRFYTWLPIIDLGWNTQLLVLISLTTIGASLCAAYWFSRS